MLDPFQKSISDNNENSNLRRRTVPKTDSAISPSNSNHMPVGGRVNVAIDIEPDVAMMREQSECDDTNEQIDPRERCESISISTTIL